jgi:LynF/TruF/PatF family peptide O-prenyltransferase
MVTSAIQTTSLSDQRLRFIKAHRQAFEVEPSLYPLEIFEDFIAKLDDNSVSSLEASCKIEADKLLAARFLAFINPPFESSLAQALKFYRQVENRVGVRLNYDLLEQFIGKSFDFSKVRRFTVGVDLRQNLADSSLKMHIVLDNYPEKVATALALDGNHYSDALRWIALQTVSLVGFDFYLDGRSEIEFYSELTEEQFQQPQIRALLEQSFSPAALEPLKVSDAFYTGLSKANANPVLYYHLKDKKELLNYFAINDMARKVHAFYQHQEVLAAMWVGVAQQELLNSRIDNIRLYYYKSLLTDKN